MTADKKYSVGAGFWTKLIVGFVAIPFVLPFAVGAVLGIKGGALIGALVWLVLGLLRAADRGLRYQGTSIFSRLVSFVGFPLAGASVGASGGYVLGGAV